MTFQVGDRVIHPSLGEGLVMVLEGSCVGTSFDNLSNGHNLSGNYLMRRNSGWWCLGEELTLIESVKNLSQSEKVLNKIHQLDEKYRKRMMKKKGLSYGI